MFDIRRQTQVDISELEDIIDNLDEKEVELSGRTVKIVPAQNYLCNLALAFNLSNNTKDYLKKYVRGKMELSYEWVPLSEEEIIESEIKKGNSESFSKDYAKRRVGKIFRQGKQIGEYWIANNNPFVAIKGGKIIGYMAYWTGPSTLYDGAQLDTIFSNPEIEKSERNEIESNLLKYFYKCEADELP